MPSGLSIEWEAAKAAASEKRAPSRKCSRHHSSFMLFCSGVPVMRHLLRKDQVDSSWYSADCLFFRRWASSTIRDTQGTAFSRSASRSAISYVVTSASNL